MHAAILQRAEDRGKPGTQDLHEQYRRDCKNVRILERLERKELTPDEKIERYRRRLKRLPAVYKAREAIKQQGRKTGPIVDEPSRRIDDLREWDRTQLDPEFGEGYALGSLEDELARARCLLSRALWEKDVLKRGGKLPERRLRH